MNLKSRITTTRARLKNASAALALTLTLAVTSFVLALPVFAHGGFDHVSGTVVKVVDKVLTVKTTKGNVDVKLDDKTELTKNDQKAALADLKPGVRVIVDIPEGSKDKIAHSVKIGVAAAGHDATK